VTTASEFEPKIRKPQYISAAFEPMPCAPEQYLKLIVSAPGFTAVNFAHRIPCFYEDCLDNAHGFRYALSDLRQPTPDRRFARFGLDIAYRRVFGIRHYSLNLVRAVMFVRQQKIRKQRVSLRTAPASYDSDPYILTALFDFSHIRRIDCKRPLALFAQQLPARRSFADDLLRFALIFLDVGPQISYN
jgi:hypothetical protein